MIRGTTQAPASRGIACFLCGETSGRTLWKEATGYEARVCSCGLISAYPQPADGEHDATTNTHPDEFYDYPARYKARWVARHCPPGRLLEVGCGSGSFLRAAREFGYEVQGIEPDPGVTRPVDDGPGIPVERTFLEGNRLPKRSFDVVYHCDMLAHFPNPKNALREMTSLLRPGGVLCFEVGFDGDLPPYWYNLIEGMGGLHLGVHRWLWSERSLTLLLACVGLRIMEMKQFSLVPEFLAGTASRIIRRKSRGSGGNSAPGQSVGSSRMKYLRYYLVRYRAGAFLPGWGPQTALVVAGASQGG